MANIGVPGPEPVGRRVLANVVEGLAVGVQAVVLFGTSITGRVWKAGCTQPPITQAVAAFVPLLWLAPRRRPGLMLLVPVVSGALSVGLFMTAQTPGQTGP